MKNAGCDKEERSNTKLCFYSTGKISDSLIFNDTPIKSRKTTNTNTLSDINSVSKALS